MYSSAAFVKTSLGMKSVMAVSGLALCGFVLIHMAGNLLIFLGPKSYNLYSHKLTSNPLLIIAELGLVVFFVGHIINGILLTLKNKGARKVPYAGAATGPKATSVVSKTLIVQGALIFVFVVLHLITFKYGNSYDAIYDGEKVRDLFKLVQEVFRNPIYVVWYVVALVVLGFHLGHGAPSMFQSLGIHHPKYQCLIKRIGYLYAVIVAVGFISQPLYIFFIYHE